MCKTADNIFIRCSESKRLNPKYVCITLKHGENVSLDIIWHQFIKTKGLWINKSKMTLLFIMLPFKSIIYHENLSSNIITT